MITTVASVCGNKLSGMQYDIYSCWAALISIFVVVAVLFHFLSRILLLYNLMGISAEVHACKITVVLIFFYHSTSNLVEIYNQPVHIKCVIFCVTVI